MFNRKQFAEGDYNITLRIIPVNGLSKFVTKMLQCLYVLLRLHRRVLRTPPPPPQHTIKMLLGYYNAKAAMDVAGG